MKILKNFLSQFKETSLQFLLYEQSNAAEDLEGTTN